MKRSISPNILGFCKDITSFVITKSKLATDTNQIYTKMAGKRDFPHILQPQRRHCALFRNMTFLKCSANGNPPVISTFGPLMG